MQSIEKIMKKESDTDKEQVLDLSLPPPNKKGEEIKLELKEEKGAHPEVMENQGTGPGLGQGHHPQFSNGARGGGGVSRGFWTWLTCRSRPPPAICQWGSRGVSRGFGTLLTCRSRPPPAICQWGSRGVRRGFWTWLRSRPPPSVKWYALGPPRGTLLPPTIWKWVPGISYGLPLLWLVSRGRCRAWANDEPLP